MLFNQFGYLPGLLVILSHSELIPDAALTLTRKKYNWEKSLISIKKWKIVWLHRQIKLWTCSIQF